MEQGLARHIGVCNFNKHKLKALSDQATIVPEMNQVELHPMLHQPNCWNSQGKWNAYSYSPLGSPDRSAGMKAADEPNLFQNPVIQELTLKHGCSEAQIMISWAMARGTALFLNPLILNANNRILNRLRFSFLKMT